MISGDLEYLMSSLPYLTFQNEREVRLQISSLLQKYAGPADEEQDPDLVEILDGEAAKFLSPSETRLLRSIHLQNVHEQKFQESGNPVLTAFSTFARTLKEEIRDLRIARREGHRASALKNSQLAIGPGTPLEEELQILKMQWEKAEEFSVGHHADFGALIAYKLKLMVLLRWWSFDKEKGFEKFTELAMQNRS